MHEYKNPKQLAISDSASFAKSFYQKLDLVADGFWHDLEILHTSDAHALENFGRVYALLQKLHGLKLSTINDQILFRATNRVLAGVLILDKALSIHTERESDMQEMERLLLEMDEAGFLDGIGSLVWRLRQVQFYIRKTSGFLKALLSSDMSLPPGQLAQDSLDSAPSSSEQNQLSQDSVPSIFEQKKVSQDSRPSPIEQSKVSEESVSSPSQQQGEVPQAPDQSEDALSQMREDAEDDEDLDEDEEDDVRRSERMSAESKPKSNVSEEVNADLEQEATILGPKEQFSALKDAVTHLMIIVGQLMLEIAEPARRGQFLGDDVLDAGDRTAVQLENLGAVAQIGKKAIMEMVGGNASDKLLTEVPKLADALHGLIRRMRKKPAFMKGIIYVEISRLNVHMRTMRWIEQNGGWVELNLPRNAGSSSFFTVDSVAIATENAFGLDPPSARLVSVELFSALQNWDSAVPEDCRWTGWTEWSMCSVTCGSGGFRYKRRICLSMNGVLCEGVGSEEALCAANFSCELYLPVICPEDEQEVNITEPVSTEALVPSTYRYWYTSVCVHLPACMHVGMYVVLFSLYCVPVRGHFMLRQAQ